ncbi:hypothetical protein MHK_003826, partial [Candidatus Magnetomorum sp. HK-1]
LYKETFIHIYHQDTDYDPNDIAQSWLQQYGLIKELNGKAIIANPIYMKRFATISKYISSRIEQQEMDDDEDKPVIFLCHAKEDIQFVKSLYHRLKQENLSPWLDEIKGDIFVIPVKIEPCKLEQRLSDIHSVDLFEEHGYEKLIQGIKYQNNRKNSTVKNENKNHLQPKELIQQLKQEINKLSLNSNDKEDIHLQINMLETQLKTNRKQMSIIKVVLETIQQL